MIDILTRPWPWYVAGPLIGLIVPLLLVVGNKQFGISTNLRHMCAAVVPGRVAFFRYDWKASGLWNLVFVVGILVGGLIAGRLAGTPEVALSAATAADLRAAGVTDLSGLAPPEIFSWAGLLSARGAVMIVLGGFLVGFGASWAGGCTSGHAIMGLADLQLPSLIAVLGFFAGGLLVTHLVLPLLI
jgi:uncharacterized membrane protein YedE/YeeE